MDNTICPACGSDNTRCEREFTNDSIAHPEIVIVCETCGNSGKATYDGPRDVYWEREEKE